MSFVGLRNLPSKPNYYYSGFDGKILGECLYGQLQSALNWCYFKESRTSHEKKSKAVLMAKLSDRQYALTKRWGGRRRSKEHRHRRLL